MGVYMPMVLYVYMDMAIWLYGHIGIWVYGHLRMGIDVSAQNCALQLGALNNKY